MRDKAIQTEVSPSDSINDIQGSMSWYRPSTRCVEEDAATVACEISAQVSDHLTLARQSCMEPVFSMKGLSMSCVKRFFSRWPMAVTKDGAFVWE
eukprot:3448775-Pleurochrysis_carterae.AAC.1